MPVLFQKALKCLLNLTYNPFKCQDKMLPPCRCALWFHTYVQDGGERGGGDVRADRGEHRLADLSDVAAGLGQQRQQDVHHHLGPVGLQLLFS